VVRSTHRLCVIPPTAVGGFFRSCLQDERGLYASSNPTHGGEWIVQLLPTFGQSILSTEFRSVRAIQKVTRAAGWRMDLNDPPTAVGGIPGSRRALFVCRLQLNNPPTAVGGIRGWFTKSPQSVVVPAIKRERFGFLQANHGLTRSVASIDPRRDMNEQIEETRKQIRDAFGEVERPRKSEIAPHRCEERDELRDTFSALKWDSIDPAIIDSNFAQLSLFSPIAYHYFLPAYLLRCLDSFDASSIVCEFTIYALASSLEREDDKKWHSERLKEFTEAQRMAIISFLNLVKATESFSDFHDDARNGCAHWQRS
jgi:hypothetical protein